MANWHLRQVCGAGMGLFPFLEKTKYEEFGKSGYMGFWGLGCAGLDGGDGELAFAAGVGRDR